MKELKQISFGEVYLDNEILRHLIRLRINVTFTSSILIIVRAIFLGIGYIYRKPQMYAREYRFLGLGILGICIYLTGTILFFNYLQAKYDVISRYIDITYERKLERE